jgi:predicted Fe-Mo cluster-binding NifX family protein
MRQKEQSMPKVAVTSEGPGLQDRVDPRFGRAGGFVIVDVETMATKYVDNGQVQTLSHGAGIQAAELIANSEAEVLLTGSVGPKAFQALNAVGIKIGIDLSNMSVQDAVQLYKEGKVVFADKPNK